MAEAPRPVRAALLRERLRSDRGTSLAELLVYIILMVILTAVIASTFINGRGVQQDQKSLADASNEAQLAAATIEGAVRNAATIQVNTADLGGDLLVVKTRVGEDNEAASSWRCVAWFYDDETRSLYELKADPGTEPATAGITERPDLSTWRLVAPEVIPSTGVDGDVLPIFRTTGVGGGVVMRFETTSTRPEAPVRITTTIMPRLQGPGIGEETCGEYL